jgi:hypothetical protein
LVVVAGWRAFGGRLVGSVVAFDAGQGTTEDACTRSVTEPLVSALRAARRSDAAWRRPMETQMSPDGEVVASPVAGEVGTSVAASSALGVRSDTASVPVPGERREAIAMPPDTVRRPTVTEPTTSAL